MPNNTNPTTSERFFFDNNVYLVLENLLKESHVEILLNKLYEVMNQRREAEKKGTTKKDVFPDYDPSPDDYDY